jgi:hypothetical protein
VRDADGCIAADPDLWFGESGIPYPADACQGSKTVAQVQPDAGGVMLLRPAPNRGLRSTWTVVTKIRNWEQCDK